MEFICNLTANEPQSFNLEESEWHLVRFLCDKPGSLITVNGQSFLYPVKPDATLFSGVVSVVSNIDGQLILDSKKTTTYMWPGKMESLNDTVYTWRRIMKWGPPEYYEDVVTCFPKQPDSILIDDHPLSDICCIGSPLCTYVIWTSLPVKPRVEIPHFREVLASIHLHSREPTSFRIECGRITSSPYTVHMGYNVIPFCIPLRLPVHLYCQYIVFQNPSVISLLSVKMTDFVHSVYPNYWPCAPFKKRPYRFQLGDSEAFAIDGVPMTGRMLFRGRKGFIKCEKKMRWTAVSLRGSPWVPGIDFLEWFNQ